MKWSRHLSRMAWATLFASVITGVILPGLLGAVLRARIDSWLDTLGGDTVQINVISRHTGWFTSEYRLQISSPWLSNSGDGVGSRQALLLMTHGPVLWHLRSSPLALAELQLLPDSSGGTDRGSDSSQHFSASAIVSMSLPARITFRMIAGLTTLGGDHWLEAQASWPVTGLQRNWQQTLQLSAWLDTDAEALGRSPVSSALNEYIQQGVLRLHSQRLLSQVNLNRGELYINGQHLSVNKVLTTAKIR